MYIEEVRQSVRHSRHVVWIYRLDPTRGTLARMLVSQIDDLTSTSSSPPFQSTSSSSPTFAL